MEHFSVFKFFYQWLLHRQKFALKRQRIRSFLTRESSMYLIGAVTRDTFTTVNDPYTPGNCVGV